jgi:hypothetical protein
LRSLEIPAENLADFGSGLETVAEHAADEFAWPAPFTLEMQSCGYPNARWDLPTHKLTVCYELASEFAGLYCTFADLRADGSATRTGQNVKQPASAFSQAASNCITKLNENRTSRGADMEREKRQRTDGTLTARTPSLECRRLPWAFRSSSLSHDVGEPSVRRNVVERV